jgi:RecJ-like exonuclease
MSERTTNGKTFELSVPTGMVERLNTAINLLSPTSKPIKIISHYDGDGLCAGAVICSTLARMNKLYHISLQHNLDPSSEIFSKLQNAGECIKIFTDLGSSRLDEIEKYDGWSIILDHHKPKRDSDKTNVVHINTHLFGINGTYELSAATLAFLLSIQASSKNWDLAPIALAGAISDKQHKNGFSGINQEILENALNIGLLEKRLALKLPMGTAKQALMRSTDPYILGLSNNEDGTMVLLDKLKIDPELNLDDLDKSQKQQLASHIILKLLDQDIPPEDAEEFIMAKLFSKKFDIELEEFSHIINASGRMSRMGVGVAAALGDPDAMSKAKELRKEHKQYILDGLKKLEDSGLKTMQNIQYFYENTAEFAGTFAGIGMMYFFDQSKPVIALSRSDKDIKVSGRGTKRLVNRGLDLATIFSEITVPLGGTGGGHQIAAGATIPSSKEKEFLKKVDELVGKQLKVKS